MRVESVHPISLTDPPKILRMSGRRLHGLHGKEQYRLDQFWCLNLFQGEGDLYVDGNPYHFEHGYAGITWPGSDLVYVFRQKTIKTWAHFIPVSGEGQKKINIPVMQDLGVEFDRIRGELELLSSYYRIQPARAVAHFWDLLWQLIPHDVHERHGEKSRHPAVSRAMNEIDMHISEPIRADDLARELGVSLTHLNRLFKAAEDTTVGDYIRRRRMELAQHLLRHTTMPIKEIASSVGIPDAQHFNKAVRRKFGISPKVLRNGV